MSRARSLHPGAWWGWVLGLSVAASRIRNPVLYLLILAVAGYVVAARRGDAPWARSYGTFLRIGLVLLAIRVALQVLFGASYGGQVLVHLPSVPLPSWAAGVRLGGDLTLPSLLGAVYEGLQLATIMALAGAANSLANPTRLLRSLPAALYEAGVAVTVALTFFPRAVETAQRVRAARRLRGRPTGGLRGLRGMAMPVLEGALDGALELAAAMDSRGYGRKGSLSPTRRRCGTALMLGGLLACAGGSYGLLNDSGGGKPLALPGLGAGGLLLAVGLLLGGRSSVRTRYRPDPWQAREWLVLGCGLVPAVVTVLAPAGLDPALTPVLVWPGLPLLPTLALLIAALPALVAPAPRSTPHRLRQPAALEAAA